MITGSKIRLRDKKVSDARNDYAWQTDPELARLDATQPLSMSYTRYLLDYSWELRNSSSQRHRLAVETLDGWHIGNCSYYDVDETRGEAQLGIMIGDRNYWDAGYGADVVTTLVSYIFRETRLDRIYLKTLKWNKRAQRCFHKCGFREYSELKRDGYHFVLMELYRDQWQQMTAPQPDVAVSEKDVQSTTPVRRLLKRFGRRKTSRR